MDLRTPHQDLMVGTETLDDAGVFRLRPDLALVQTVDYFTPVVDDPYAFGQIAAANALSDVYAMGATPLTVLNIVGYPIAKLPHETLARILEGGADKVREAGAVIVGGHSIDDNEPKFGMAVTGTCHPDNLWTNAGARAGDALVLTKPIGIGVITTAIKRGLATPEEIAQATQVMAELNKTAAEVGRSFEVHACTDVTGFGLLGHGFEMTRASGLHLTIHAHQVPVLESAFRFVKLGAVPSGSKRNHEHVALDVTYQLQSPEFEVLLTDAVTSGGLLMSLPVEQADELVQALHQNGVSSAAVVGEFREGTPHIDVV